MVDERTIVADIKSWIDELSVGGFRAEVEEHAEEKRTDLRVFHRNRILFNGEFKRPFTIEGRNAKSASLVKDAFVKAASIPSRFFVTSNLNETVIWDRSDSSRPLMSMDVQALDLTPTIKNDADFEREDCRNALKSLMQHLVETVHSLSRSKSAQYRPLGQSFIEGLNSHLGAAVAPAIRHIPPKSLRAWWREQGYLMPPGDRFTDEHRERMARYSFYVLANRIVFYYVLKRTFVGLPGIHVPDEITSIKDVRKIMRRSFDDAQEFSGDFETVYEEGIADFVPFCDDELIYPLVSLVKFLEAYDFSTLSQDILGNLYDRLISPEERHANGQYYTPIPVVDMINALTIKDQDARVLDPACGSGTFLTRAFDLKLHLNRDDSKETKEKAVEELFGVDIADYPTHLATIALSSKLLFQNPEVYPRIVHSDFLDVMSEAIVPRFRFGSKIEDAEARTLNREAFKVEFRPIDAVVSNLPYIRQEEIGSKKEEQKKIKTWLSLSGYAIDKEEDIPGNKADFHAYFWHYVLPFLREGSRIGFLTSDTWLNVEYGQNLKKFINKYFRIVAVIDSSVERWFEDALVNTVITVLERTDDKSARKNNRIKFVRINRKIAEVVPDIDSALKAARDIEKGRSTKDITIMREVKQGDIDFDDVLKSKFFPHLRGPDEFFQLVNSDKMVPLKEVMNVQYGIKTGANEFFYVEDVTDEYSPEELQSVHGLRQGETARLRIVRDGTGQEHTIEKEYLRPILKGPKEFTKEGKLIFGCKTKKLVVLIADRERNRIKSHALAYIGYGERKGYPQRASLRHKNPWWMLSPIIEPDIALSDQLSSIFVYPKTKMLLDKKLYFGTMSEKNGKLLGAYYSFLNSSLSYLYPDCYGCTLGGGSTAMAVSEYQNLPVPQSAALEPFCDGLSQCMSSLENRKIGSVFEEIWDGRGQFSLECVMKDRYELDKMILMALGIEPKFLFQWYQSIVRIVKERLEKARSLHMSKTSTRGFLDTIATEIIKSIGLKNFPEDYVIPNDRDMTLTIDTSSCNNPSKDITWNRDLEGYFVSVKDKKTYFDDKWSAEYGYYCALQRKDKVTIPKDSEVVVRALRSDIMEWKSRIEELIDEQTDDEGYKAKLLKKCIGKAGHLLAIRDSKTSGE
ncbi:MAG: N-6 DNA methylase [Thermoplasmata archaeon]|nr:N-6 DNA methylase [Candidatus Sysuiplasma jiujiangense]